MGKLFTLVRRCLLLAIALPALAVAQTTLVVWHDLGDNGVKWFNQVNELYKKTHPDVTITSVSYPTDQWFGRVIGAINTNTAPDLIFNNYERVIRIQNQTGKVSDMKAELATLADKSFLSEDDLRVATYKGRMIILPVQRVQMALGARKSWLAQVGEPFPKTWDDFLRTAKKFQEIKDGGAVRYGVALQAAKPRDLIHMLDLFMLGSGIRYTVIDPAGKVVIDEPRHAEVLKEFLKVFSSYKLTSPDTINYSFSEMYQVIEGGRAGFFRVGDWNVKKWDSEAIKGDFVMGPWPAFKAGDKNAVVIGGMRGIAVPENSPNKAKAIEFAKFLLGKDAQAASLANVGSAVRRDLPLDGLSERQAWFAKGDHPMIAYDFPESVIPAYPEVEAAYHKALLGALANPPANIDAFIKSTAQELQKIADAKKT